LRLTSLMVSFAVLFFAIGRGASAQPLESKNLIQKEMLALDSALKVTIDAIVLNELGRIHPAFEEAHRIRQQVEQAIKGDRKILLPRNQKRFKEYVRLDNKFHRDIELLLRAAKKNKMAAVQRQTHLLLDACVRCHAIFWK